MRGRILTEPHEIKLFTFWDALTRQRTDGALVRLVTPVYRDEKPEQSEARLQAFAGKIVPILNGYLPGD
jgi:EpsI family protein